MIIKRIEENQTAKRKECKLCLFKRDNGQRMLNMKLLGQRRWEMGK